MKTRILLFIAAALQIVWGLVPSASQYVINEIPVELYIALRWTISGLIFVGYLILSKKLKTPPTLDFMKVILLGICGYALGSFGTLYGLKLGGITNFALMGALNPMITSGVAFVILKERPQKIFFIALPLCILGLGFLVLGKHEISNLNVTLSAAALIMGAAVFVSVIACVFCYAILYWLLNHMDGHRLALFDGLHVLSASFFGWALFHERLNQSMIVGGVLLVMSLVLGNLPNSGSASRVTPEAENLG